MANLYNTNIRRRQIADTFYHLKKIKSKLQRKAADIGFVTKALAYEVTPTFAKVKGQFKSIKDRWKAEKIILNSQLKQHYHQLALLRKEIEKEECRIKETKPSFILSHELMCTFRKEVT